MIRLVKDDYYIYEPTMLINNTFCIPTRWFVRGGVFHAKAWVLQPTVQVDEEGWVVREDLEIEVSQEDLLKNFPCFAADHRLYNIPHPSRILGE